MSNNTTIFGDMLNLIISLEYICMRLLVNSNSSLQQFRWISNLLNNGDVPNLFNTEEKTKIVDEISNFMPIGTFN